MRYRTQKARGVHAIYNGMFTTLRREYGLVEYPPGELIVLPHASPYQVARLIYPRFARPCPTVPRHGFVESRVVNNKDELESVLRETLEQDSNGEVIVMPALSGKFSGVATNAGVAWGQGNDGVTNGGGNVFVPAPTPISHWNKLVSKLHDYYGDPHDIKDDFSAEAVPYVELVEHQGEIVPVQVRAGPPQTASKNFIPKEWKVKRVIEPEDKFGSDGAKISDALLQWESTIASAILANKGEPDGLVVYMPGASLSSHWAVHAIQNGIPFLAEADMPMPGDVLEPQGEAPTPLTRDDCAVIAKALKKFKKDPIFGAGGTAAQILAVAQATCHAATFWNGQPHLLRFRALAAEAMVRFISAACLGEARHFFNNGPGRMFGDYTDPDNFDSEEEYNDWREDHARFFEQKPNVPWDKVVGQSSRTRNLIYDEMLQPMPDRSRTSLLKAAAKDFRMPGWGDWTDDDEACGYGGPNWANLCDCALRLIETRNAFIANPCQQTWKETFLAMNLAAHVAHNGGNIGSKWIRGTTLDWLADRPGLGFMNHYAGKFALEAA